MYMEFICTVGHLMCYLCIGLDVSYFWFTGLCAFLALIIKFRCLVFHWLCRYYLKLPARSWIPGDLKLQLILTYQNLFIMNQSAFFLAFYIFPVIAIDYDDTSAHFVTLKSKNNVF